MSNDINSVAITGNLTRDPEVRTTAGGTSVLTCGICANSRRNNNGVWEDKPNFIDWTMFGSRAQAVAQYLAKGAKVAIHGRLDYQTWQDRQSGQSRSKLEVIADEVVLMQRPRNEQPAQYQQPAPAQPVYQQPAPVQPVYQQPAPVQPAQGTIYDQDIPF